MNFANKSIEHIHSITPSVHLAHIYSQCLVFYLGSKIQLTMLVFALQCVSGARSGLIVGEVLFLGVSKKHCSMTF